jgi:hypothetical protein
MYRQEQVRALNGATCFIELCITGINIKATGIGNDGKETGDGGQLSPSKTHNDTGKPQPE